MNLAHELPKNILLGLQFLIVAFGATVMVPLLIGIDPSIALFSAGVGTLIFHLVTRGMVPVFLGSSFAFITPITEATRLFGFAGTLSGIVAVGLVYGIMSAVVKYRGIRFIEKIFPSVVVGPVIMVIGLSLAPVGINMAKTDWPLALVTLIVAIIVVVFTKGMLKLIPVVCAVVAGYIVAITWGKVDFSVVAESTWISLPVFTMPEFHWGAILYLVPVALAPVIEHVGDIYAVGAVAEKKFVTNPGLHRTMLGDGIATSVAGLMGSVPNTTYSEVTGAILLTKVANPVILRISAIAAILFSLIGKVGGVLESIPQSVLGGAMILVFGIIASVGIKTLQDTAVDLKRTRNQVIIAVVLTTGIGGAVMQIGNFSLSGIGMAAVAGVILNLVIPDSSKPVNFNK